MVVANKAKVACILDADERVCIFWQVFVELKKEFSVRKDEF